MGYRVFLALIISSHYPELSHLFYAGFTQKGFGMAKSDTKTKQFTPVGLDRLKPLSARYEKAEPGGLRVVVGKRTKSFFYRYKSPVTGKHRNLHLGNYPAISLSAARDKVTAAKEMLIHKVDPWDQLLDARKAMSDAPTLDEVITDYLNKVASKKKSGHEDKRYLEKEISPELGKMKIGMIKRSQIVAVIDKIAKRAPISARNCLVYTRLAFQHALERGQLEANPCSQIKPPATAKARQRVLTDSEVKQFWNNVTALEVTAEIISILQLCLVTGQRSGEVRQMKWADLDGGWWTIPPAITKNKLAHRVPLSPMALGILSTTRDANHDGDYVFPGKKAGNPLGRNSADQALRRNANDIDLEDFTIHDLRRTAASNMAALGVPRLVVGQILNHAERGVTAVYDRHSYDQEKMAAQNKWDTKLANILGLKSEREKSPEEITVANFIEEIQNAPAFKKKMGKRSGKITVGLNAKSWAVIIDRLKASN